MASVTFEHVVKKFGDFTAIADLDIEIQDKEFLVLVGPSGCGKTTALRCLAGLGRSDLRQDHDRVTRWSMISHQKIVTSPWCSNLTLFTRT